MNTMCYLSFLLTLRTAKLFSFTSPYYDLLQPDILPIIVSKSQIFPVYKTRIWPRPR